MEVVGAMRFLIKCWEDPGPSCSCNLEICSSSSSVHTWPPAMNMPHNAHMNTQAPNTRTHAHHIMYTQKHRHSATKTIIEQLEQAIGGLSYSHIYTYTQIITLDESDKQQVGVDLTKFCWYFSEISQFLQSITDSFDFLGEKYGVQLKQVLIYVHFIWNRKI